MDFDFSAPALPTNEVVSFTKDVTLRVETHVGEQFRNCIPVLYSKATSWDGSTTYYHVKVHVDKFARYIDLKIKISAGNIAMLCAVDANATRESPIRPQPANLPFVVSDAALPTLLVQIGIERIKHDVTFDMAKENPEFKFKKFNPVLFRQQTTAGKTYYWVKVQTGDEEYLHVCMWTVPVQPKLLLVTFFHDKSYTCYMKKQDWITPSY